MFRISGLELTDVGRHKHIKKEFDGSLIGLAAPNGEGKTTILQAIQWILTGNIDSKDPISAWIRRSSGPKAPKSMFGAISFEADGKIGRIERKATMSGQTRKLTYEGILDDEGKMKELTSDAEVNAALFAILGVDKKAINTTVFIKQGEIGKLFGMDTERREFYTKLMMLGGLEKIGDITEGFRKSIGGSVQDLSSLKDAADADYEAALSRYDEYSGLLGRMRDWSAEQKAAEHLVTLISASLAADLAYDRAKEQDTQLLEVLAGLTPDFYRTTWENTLKQARADLAKANLNNSIYFDADRELNTNRAKVAQAVTDADNHRQWETLKSQRGSYEAILEKPSPQIVIDDCRKRLDTRSRVREIMPLKSTAAARLAAASAALTAADADVESHKEAFRAADKDYQTARTNYELRKELYDEIVKTNLCDASQCPVCGNAANLDFLTRTMNEAFDEAERLRAIVDECITEGTRSRGVQKAAEQERTAAELDDRNLNNELVVLQLHMKDMPSTEDLMSRKAAAEEELISYIGARTSIDSIDRDMKRLKVERHVLNEEEITALQELLKTKEAEFVKLTPPTENDKVRFECDRSIESAEAKLKFLEANLDKSRKAQELQVAAAKASQDYLSGLEKSHAPLYRILSKEIVDHTYAQTVADDVKKKQEEFVEQKGKVAASKAALDAASAKVEELDLRVAEQQVRVALEEKLKRMRDAFRPAGVTTEFLDYKFGLIAAMATDYLAEAGADFIVMASPDAPLSYDFLRTNAPDEAWLPQSRLSGGQKVRLAIATLRAIHALIMPNVGLLVLDEPTTHLDETAKKSMVEMLQRISDEGTLQMIVCDHDPVLIDAFSDIIEIPRA